MGLDIDPFRTESSLNSSPIREILENFHSLLLLYEDFDKSIKKLNVSKCAKLFVDSYTKLTQDLSIPFNETQFRAKYTSIPMNAYTLFITLDKDEDFLFTSLNTYLGDRPNLNAYVDSLFKGTADINEVYENVIKDVTTNEESELMEKIMTEFYSKMEVMVKVLFYLTYKSFELIGTYSDLELVISLPNTKPKLVTLADLLLCYSDLGLFSYFIDLLESYVKTYMDFRIPPHVADKANRISQKFNVNLHIKLYTRDEDFAESLKDEISTVLEDGSEKLVALRIYMTEVMRKYGAIDKSKCQFAVVEFDLRYIKELLNKFMRNYYKEFAETASLMIPIVDAVEVIDEFKGLVEGHGLIFEMDYVEEYMKVAHKNWENHLMAHVRNLSINQYPMTPDGDMETKIKNNEYAVREVNYETLIDLYNTMIGKFVGRTSDIRLQTVYLTPHTARKAFGFTDPIFQKIQENCYISINLYSIVMLIMKMMALPVILNYELMYVMPKKLLPPPKSENEKKTMDRTSILMEYIDKNAKLLQKALLLYIFNSNSSFKEFLLTLTKSEPQMEHFDHIMMVFIIYLSNVYFVNHLSTMVPYMAQYIHRLYFKNYSLTAVKSSYKKLNEVIKSSYKVSVVKISLFKLQDYLTVHFSSFNQQFAQKMINGALVDMKRTSTEGRAQDLDEYLKEFKKTLSKFLAPKVYRNVYNICLDLVYNGVVYEMLEYFEEINYKFNYQYITKVQRYTQRVAEAIRNNITQSDRFQFMYERKFENFIRIFSRQYDTVTDDMYMQNEFHRLNKLMRQLRTIQ